MIFNVHAGHNPDGKTACGAIGLIRESTEARKVKEQVISLLKKEGHTVYDCTVNNGTSQNDVLSKIVKKANCHKADLDISIHFNAGRNDYKGDHSTGGTEVWVYSSASKAMDAACSVCRKIASLGLRNRGVKTSSSLYVLKKASAPAMLIECCFVDDADDIGKYSPETMGQAIAEGVLGKSLSDKSAAPAPSHSSLKTKEFKVKVLDEALNIRTGAGTNYKITGCIRDKGAYTITKVSGHWGYLKSGAGWINISTKYVSYMD